MATLAGTHVNDPHWNYVAIIFSVRHSTTEELSNLEKTLNKVIFLGRQSRMENGSEEPPTIIIHSRPAYLSMRRGQRARQFPMNRVVAPWNLINCSDVC